MKIREGFILREIAGTHVVVPLGQNVVELSIMMTLNDSGAFLWRQLAEGKDKTAVIESLVNEYGISYDLALTDVEDFLSELADRKLLEA